MNKSDPDLSRSQSTARMMVISSGGSPTVSRTITIVTSPALNHDSSINAGLCSVRTWGIPAAPMLAAVAVIETAHIWPSDRSRLLTWVAEVFSDHLLKFVSTCAMNIAATAS